MIYIKKIEDRANVYLAQNEIIFVKEFLLMSPLNAGVAFE